MKTLQKYGTYTLIVVVTATAIFLYNSLTNKTKMNQEPISREAGKDKGEKRGGGAKVLPVNFYIADYESNNEGLLGLGSLMAKERVDVVSEVSGRVVDIRFKEGQFVKKGTVLVKLNDDELQAQLKRYQYQYTLSKDKLERQKVLFNKDAISREDYESAQTDYDVLAQNIQELKAKINKCEVKAPFDGVLGLREISMGAYLVPNSKITTLVDIKDLVIEFSIPEKYATKNLIGTTASFTVEGSTKIYKARVYAMDPELDIKTRSILFRANYYNSDDVLKPGMSAKVTLAPNQNTKSIYIPNEAVISDITGKLVWIIKDGKSESVMVQTGIRTADKIEILAGVSKGDSVIVTGLMQVRPGMPVKPLM